MFAQVTHFICDGLFTDLKKKIKTQPRTQVSSLA